MGKRILLRKTESPKIGGQARQAVWNSYAVTSIGLRLFSFFPVLHGLLSLRDKSNCRPQAVRQKASDAGRQHGYRACFPSLCTRVLPDPVRSRSPVYFCIDAMMRHIQDLPCKRHPVNVWQVSGCYMACLSMRICMYRNVSLCPVRLGFRIAGLMARSHSMYA